HDPEHLQSLPTRRSSDLARSGYCLPETDHLLPKEYAYSAPFASLFYLALKKFQTQKNHMLFGNLHVVFCRCVQIDFSKSGDSRKDRKSTRLNSSHVKISY